MSAISLNDSYEAVKTTGTGNIERHARGSKSFYVVTDRQGHCSDKSVFELKWDALDYMPVASLVETGDAHFHFFAQLDHEWNIGDEFMLCRRDGKYKWRPYGQIVAIIYDRARIGDDRNVLDNITHPPRTP